MFAFGVNTLVSHRKSWRSALIFTGPMLVVSNGGVRNPAVVIVGRLANALRVEPAALLALKMKGR